MAKPSVIFAARAEGMGKNGVMISMHKDYTDFSDFIADFMMDWGDDVQEYGTLLTALKGTIVKPLSLKHLAKHYLNKMAE